MLHTSYRCVYNINIGCHIDATKGGVVLQAQIKINTEKFIELMKKHSLNMSTLAEKLNISRAQLWRVLNDKSNPGEQFIAGFKVSFPKEEFEKFFLVHMLQQSDTNSA